MTEFESLGRILVLIGLFIIVLGAILLLAGRIPFLGRLPGDIFIQRDNVTCWFPIMTSILLSILLSLILLIVNMFLRR